MENNSFYTEDVRKLLKLTPYLREAPMLA